MVWRMLFSLIGRSAWHGSVDLALCLATGQLLDRDVYMGPPLGCSALPLFIVAVGPASVGSTYKHRAVLALMLLHLILCRHDAGARDLCYYGGPLTGRCNITTTKPNVTLSLLAHRTLHGHMKVFVPCLQLN
jgi:hypothetical protein